MCDIEMRICNRLVRNALAKGYLISVYDGEEFALKRSASYAAIKSAMFSTDSDQLVFRRADGTKAGVVLLIYGNGEDVISDYSDNEETNTLVNLAQA